MAQRVRQEQGGCSRPGSCERAVEVAPSTEGFEVTGYATSDQLRTWGEFALMEVLGPCSDEDLDALLERASIDLDSYLRWPLPGPDDPVVPPLRIDVATLSTWEVWALQRACVSQAIYRAELQEDLEPSLLTSAPLVSFSPRPPDLVGTQALTVLSGCPSLHVYRHGLGTPDEPPDADVWGVDGHRVA
jgi:hypothetical protein